MSEGSKSRPRSDSMPSLDGPLGRHGRRAVGPSSLQHQSSSDEDIVRSLAGLDVAAEAVGEAALLSSFALEPVPERTAADEDAAQESRLARRLLEEKASSSLTTLVNPSLDDKDGARRQRTRSEGTAAHLQRQRVSASVSSLAQAELEKQSANLRRMSSIHSLRAPSKFTHQRHDLTSSNHKRFHYRGVIVLKNALDQEYETFDLFADDQVVRTVDEQLMLQHTIRGVDLALRDLQGRGDVARPHSVCFAYYLRASGSDRFDCLLHVTYSVASLAAEMSSLVGSAGDPATSPTGFEAVESLPHGQVAAAIAISWDRDGRQSPRAGAPFATIRQLTVRVPLKSALDPLGELTLVTEPRLSTKTMPNFWFRMEVEKRVDDMADDGAVWSPFVPVEQHLNMADSHFYIEQEIVLESFSILQGSMSHKRAPISAHNHVFLFRYFLREREPADASLFCLAALELSLAEVVECSFGFQRLRDRFKLEKYVALGMVRATFHFFVREELQPQPEASDEFQAPDRGNWLLERISIGIRVA